MAPKPASNAIRPKRKLDLSNFTLDDIIAELDEVLSKPAEAEAPQSSSSLTNTDAQPFREVRRRSYSETMTDAPKANKKGGAENNMTRTAKPASSDELTEEQMEKIKRYQALAARGINPLTGKKDVSEVRIVGPKEKKKNDAKDTTGRGWFDMPRTVMTPELKKDLQLLNMRDALEKNQFFKKDKSSSKVPKYSQMGTIIEGPTEFFSGRMTKKERKRTMVEEALADEAESKKHKRRYKAIEEENVRQQQAGRKKRRRH